MASFTITAAGPRVALESGSGRAQFTVTNTSPQSLKGRLLPRPTAPASPNWFSVVGDSVRDFGPDAAEQVVVQLTVPQGSPAGSYSFRLDAVSQLEPDEDFTEGPSVAFDVAATPAPPKKKFPWWLVIVLGVLLVVVIIVFLALR